MLIHKHCGLWHTELWCHLWSTFCLHKGLWPYLPLESVFLPEKACMRSMLVSSAGLQTPLYKPRLGHRQALPLQTGKQRATCCQELRTCFYFNHLILGALCGKLWCWLCVCWLLGSSLWMTRRMRWSYVAVSLSEQSSLPAEDRGGDGQLWVQVRC